MRVICKLAAPTEQCCGTFCLTGVDPTRPLRKFVRFCVMREDRKRANIWWAKGLPTREF
jgi:hypothetical protein